MSKGSVTRISPSIYLIDVSPAEVGEKAIACYVVKHGTRAVLIEPGPYSISRSLSSQLSLIDVRDVELIIPTHIHVDHYGSASYLIKQYDSALILVHPKGYHYILDPNYLWTVTKKYMGELADVFMKPKPISEDRVRISYDRMSLAFGSVEITILHTPGHAPHHQSIMLDTGELFVGDSAGIYIHEHNVILPMAIPPFNLKTYIDSIDYMLSYNPSHLFYTHFGVLKDAVKQLNYIRDKMLLWNDILIDKCKGRTTVQDAIKILIKADLDLKTSYKTIINRPIYKYALEMSVLGYLKYNNLI